jgi:P4 family phage/plasmid primase-like protien
MNKTTGDNNLENKQMIGLTEINELGATWFLGNSEAQPLVTCIKKAKELKHKFLVAFDYYEKGMTKPTKIYGSYKNSKQFWRKTKDCDSQERCFYVIVPEKTGCCLFADLEWDLSWKSEAQIKQKFTQVVSDTLNAIGVKLDADEYLFASASEEASNKGSLHAHVPALYFKDIIEQQRFFNAVKVQLDTESEDWFFIDQSDKSYILKTFIDFGVYNKNRQIRLPYSSKRKADGVGVRPLMPEDQETFDFQEWTIVDLEGCDDAPIDVSTYPKEIECNKRNMWSKDLVQGVLDSLGLDASVAAFKGNNLIALKNKTGSRVCPINGEVNKGDNAYLTIKNNKLHYHCHDEGCKGQSKVIHEFKEDQRIIEQKLIDACVFGSHGNCAELFQHKYGDYNIVITSQKDCSFYHWNETSLLWELEPKETMLRLINNTLKGPFEAEAKKVLKKIFEVERDPKSVEALELSCKLMCIQKLLTHLADTPYLNNIIKYYASFCINKDFESKIINKSPSELPVKNGKVISLKTLESRPRTRADFWSVECPVEFLGDGADLSSVHKFIGDITLGSADLADYHRRLWGYMLTGEISDRSLHIFWGNGCNGKSSIVNIVKGILGDTFAVNLSEDTMLKKDGRGASPEMMDLLHSRCGIMPESDKKEKLNSKRVKTITGDDDIKARHLYGHLVQFKTQCKAIWPTNHKPAIDIEDQAILDRLKLVPFLARFEKNAENTKYIKDLQENKLNQFFTWFATGARDWYAGQELIPCKEMSIEMNKYISEFDVVAEFLEDSYDIVTEEEYTKANKLDKASHRTSRQLAYQMFMMWINDNNKRDQSLGKKEFYSSFRTKVNEKKMRGVVYYLCRAKDFYERKGDEDSDSESANLPPL